MSKAFKTPEKTAVVYLCCSVSAWCTTDIPCWNCGTGVGMCAWEDPDALDSVDAREARRAEMNTHVQGWHNVTKEGRPVC
jgi:hypothetical protein